MTGGADKAKKKGPLDYAKEWQAMIGIAIAVLGGFWWLDGTYARIDKLIAEKCALSYEIRVTRGEIEFKSIDEGLDLHRSELEVLLQIVDPPKKRVDFKKGFIESQEARLKELDDKIGCLRRAKVTCFQDDTDLEKCYEE